VCPANSTRSGTSCQCNSGYYRSGNLCLANPVCRANSTHDGAGNCPCNDGFEEVGGQCLALCPANSTRSGTSCTCNSGYYMSGGVCNPNPVCRVNSTHDGNGDCPCNGGFDDVDGQCLAQCGANSHREGQSCVCDAGYKDEGGVCVPDEPPPGESGGFAGVSVCAGLCQLGG
jgi:hypothetical protein